MTAYDAVLGALAARIGTLSIRAVVALFWACSTVLLPEAEAWAERRGEQSMRILKRVLDAAYELAAFGTQPNHTVQLLGAFAVSKPQGESPDAVSSTFAQDCFICADVCLRVIAEPSYDVGPAIEYALDPIVSTTTEKLFVLHRLAAAPRKKRRSGRC